MGLYLCVFDGEEELDGVEVGHYADFNGLRSYVSGKLEGGSQGTKFPLFMLHADSDGEWDVDELPGRKEEIGVIADQMKSRPRVPFISEWQRKVAHTNGLAPSNAYESFVDVDG